MFFVSLRKSIAAVMIALLVCLAPVHVARAGGGGFFSPSALISFGMTFALFLCGVPPIFTTILAGSLPSTSAIAAAVLTQMTSFAAGEIISGGGNTTTGGGGGGGAAATSTATTTPAYNIYSVANTVSEVAAGSRAHLSGTVTNHGNSAVVGNFQNRFEIFADRIVLNASADLAPSPIMVSAGDGLMPGASTEISTDWMVPVTFKPGAYFLRLCVNVGNSAAEADYGNNCGDLQSFVIDPPAAVSSAGAASTTPPATTSAAAFVPVAVSAVGASSVGAFIHRVLPPPSTQLAAVIPFKNGPDLMASLPSIWPAPTGGTKTVLCAKGSWFDVNTSQCVLDTYISCASTGYPNNFCLADTQICNGSRCENKSGGRNCKATVGAACQGSENSCYMSLPGSKSCNGSCEALVPLDSSCALPTIDTSKTQTVVNLGKACTIRWSIMHATACSIHGDEGDSDLAIPARTIATPAVGTYVTPPLQARALYVISCDNGTYAHAQKTVICTINPKIREI